TEQALSELRMDLENVFIPVDQISQKWESLEPTIQVFYPDVEIEGVTDSISTLNLTDNIETRKAALFQIDDLLEHTTSFTLDALLWTAIMIGGTIILTLSYVSIRKFKGGQATLPSRKSENS
ncbi:sporulation protein YpjB, partial [Halobacillus sp. BBL2006]|uniref:sporulation protein YpjB n=1 Tax=Halobacillus sp. BBL2006 TaxID=1543706 RepID=UPI0005427940